jgi:flagellar hook-basal body complex protein FliE
MAPGLIERPGGNTVSLGPDEPIESGKFTDMLGELLNNVNGFLSGEPVELHQIMIKAEQAGIATDLLLEIRNKLMNAYNDIMRMPI